MTEVMKVAVSAVLGLLVAMAMVVGSAQAIACSPQFPLSCATYVLGLDPSRTTPFKTCCFEVEQNFQIVKPTTSLVSYCEAVKGVRNFNGPLAGSGLTLALALPQKCMLSGQYKKGQKCDGKIMPGGS